SASQVSCSSHHTRVSSRNTANAREYAGRLVLQQSEAFLGHGLIAFEVREIRSRLLFGSGDRVANGLLLDITADMDERRLCRLVIGIGAALESTMVRGALAETQAPLAPDDADQLLDEVLLSWSL